MFRCLDHINIDIYLHYKQESKLLFRLPFGGHATHGYVEKYGLWSLLYLLCLCCSYVMYSLKYGTYFTVLYCRVRYCLCTLLYCNVRHCIVLYCNILYYTVLYCTYYNVLYCTVHTVKYYLEIYH